jgi:hypothetical protein
MQFTSFATEEKEEKGAWAVIEIVLSQAEEEEERGGWRRKTWRQCVSSSFLCFLIKREKCVGC